MAVARLLREDQDSSISHIYLLHIEDFDSWPTELELESPFFTGCILADATETPFDVLVAFADKVLASGLVAQDSWGPNSTQVETAFDYFISDPENEHRFPEDDDYLIMTSSHKYESLESALWYSLNNAWPSQAYENQCKSRLIITVGESVDQSLVETYLKDPDKLWEVVEQEDEQDDPVVRPPEFDRADVAGSVVSITKNVLLNPHRFFAGLPKGGSYLSSLAYLTVFVVVLMIGSALGINQLDDPDISRAGNVAQSLFGGFLGTYIFAAILGLGAVIFANGQTGGFVGSWRITAYVTGATAIFEMIPFVHFAVPVYGAFLSIIGVKNVHDTTWARAVATVLIIPGLLLALMLFLAFGIPV